MRYVFSGACCFTRSIALTILFTLSMLASVSSALADVGAPTPIYPGGYITDAGPTFSWTPVSGAASYELALGDDSDVTIYFDLAGITESSFTIFGAVFDQSKVYHWKVRAAGTDGSIGAWSDIESFLIYNPATIPTAYLPAGYLTTNAPLFQWSAVTGAVSYDLLIQDEAEVTTINQFSGITDTSFSEPTTMPLPAYMVFHYKIRSHLADGSTSLWSNPGSFLIYQSIDTPKLLGPSNRASIGNTLFQWAPVESAASYELQLMSADEKTIFLDATAIATNGYNLDPTLSLSLDTVYHWRVRSIFAAGGHSLWSDPMSFLYFDAKSLPDALMPFGYIKNLTTLEWSQPLNPGVASYDIEVREAATQTVVHATSVTGTTSYTIKDAVKLSRNTTYEWRVRTVFIDGHRSLWTLPCGFQISSTLWAGQISGLRSQVGNRLATGVSLSWQPLRLSGVRYHVVLRVGNAHGVRTLWSGDANPDDPGTIALPTDLFANRSASLTYTWLVQAYSVDNVLMGESIRLQSFKVGGK